jgi:hypothetical protein
MRWMVGSCSAPGHQNYLRWDATNFQRAKNWRAEHAQHACGTPDTRPKKCEENGLQRLLIKRKQLSLL